MDDMEHGADVAVHHYSSRLLSSMFGQWVSYVAETKALEEEAERTALHYYRPAVLESAMFRLKWIHFVMNKQRYNSILAAIGRSFILQKRGLCFLQKRVRKMRSGKPMPGHSCSNAQEVTRMGMHRFFKRWKSKADTASIIGRALRGAISTWTDASPVTVSRTLLVQGQFKQWKVYTAGVTESSKAYESGKRWFLRQLKKRYLGRLAGLPRIVRTEQDQQQALERYFALRQMLRGLRRLKRHCQQRARVMAQKQVVGLCAVRLAKRRGVAGLQQLLARSRRARFSAAQVQDVYTTAARRRVLWRLLQLLKLRFLCNLPVRTKVQMHLLHNWATRRRSFGMLTWMCHTGRRKVESRRQKIAAFQWRDRRLRLAFADLRVSLRALKVQRNAIRDGRDTFRQAKFTQALAQLDSFCTKKRLERLSNYRAVLCWKYTRTLRGLACLKANAEMRRGKRRMLQEARIAYEQRERRAACAEFLRVAHASPLRHLVVRPGSGLTERQAMLAARAAARWKALVVRKRSSRVSVPAQRTRYTAPPSAAWPALTAPQPALAPAAGREVPRVREALSHSKVEPARSSDIANLSRAKPRGIDVDFISLPPPLQSCALDFRTQLTALASRGAGDAAYVDHRPPYAYLSTGSAVPIPSWRTQARFARDNGDQQDFPKSAHQDGQRWDNGAAYKEAEPTLPELSEVEVEQAPPPPLPLPSVSEDMLSAVEELLDSGSTVTPATLLALRGYLQEQQDLLQRQR